MFEKITERPKITKARQYISKYAECPKYKAQYPQQTWPDISTPVAAGKSDS